MKQEKFRNLCSRPGLHASAHPIECCSRSRTFSACSVRRRLPAPNNPPPRYAPESASSSHRLAMRLREPCFRRRNFLRARDQTESKAARPEVTRGLVPIGIQILDEPWGASTLTRSRFLAGWRVLRNGSLTAALGNLWLSVINDWSLCRRPFPPGPLTSARVSVATSQTPQGSSAGYRGGA
jgi:hypothetical protein